MTAPFLLSTLRCACGSADILSVDPGSDAEIDDVFRHWVLKPEIPARGWCVACVDAFAPLLPREGKRNA